MRNRENRLVFGTIALFVSIVAVGFVYAGFTGTLNINGTGSVTASKWDIYFANLSNAVTTGNANVIEAATIKTKTSIGDYLVEFSELGDSITYTFDVVNDGSFDALLTVLQITAPQCSGGDATSNEVACRNLEYTLKYTSNNEPVRESDSLLKGETKNMTLKLQVKNNGNLSGVTRDVEIGGLGIMMMYSQASGYNGSGTIVNSEDKGFGIINTKASSQKNNGVDNSNSYNNFTFDSSVTLPNTNSEVTYDVVIYNGSNKDYIFSGENVLEHTNNDIEYTLSISEGYKLKAGNSVVVKVTYKPKSNASLTNDTLNSEIEFEFKEFYNITYTNISGTYPTYIYKNETREIDFSGTVYNLIEVYQGNTKLSPLLNYTFDSQILTITNISGDIEVRYVGNFCTENNLTKLNECIIARDVEEPNVNSAKTLIAAKGESDYTKIEPSITYAEKIDYSLSSNNITNTTNEVIYFGTGTPTFNTEDGTWTITRTHTGSIPEYLSDSNTKYYTCLTTSINCSTLYVIYNYRTVTNSTTGAITYYITNADRYTYQVTGNSSSNNGIFKTTDDYGDTYYYRGIVNNNFVKFGENSSGQPLYWRIVRVNGDNSIRLIYNGTNTNQTGTSTQIGTSAFNSNSYDPAMIGYTYNLDQEYKETTNTLTYTNIASSTNYVFGTSLNCTNNPCTIGGTTVTNTWYNFAKSWDGTTPYYTCFGIGGSLSTSCSIAMQIVGTVASGSDIHKTQARVKYKGYLSKTYNGITNPIGSVDKDTDSTIKTRIDTWYEQNLKNTAYENYLADNIFCNDRSIYSGTGQDLETHTYYAPFRRSYKSGKTWPTYTPLLSCPRQIDEYTVSVDSTNNRGNGKLDYPIGLITVDEMRLAGGSYDIMNSYYWMYTGQYYWSASASYFGTTYAIALVWNADTTGLLNNRRNVSSGLGVRPVINLSSNTLISGGNGSSDSPFELSLP